jgi:hypothetical protein
MSASGASPHGPLRLRSTLEWREVDGEIVALDLDRSVYLAANSSGALMWRLLSDGTTRDELVEALTDAYAVDRPTAERDVATFLEQVEANACLEPGQGEEA